MSFLKKSNTKINIITDKALAKKLADYKKILEKVQEFENSYVSFSESGLFLSKNAYSSEYLAEKLADQDFKGLSTYKNQNQSKFIVDIMENGLFKVINENKEFDKYSYYNNCLFAHKKCGGWVSLDNLSPQVFDLMKHMDELKSFHSSYIEMLTGFPSCSDKGRLFKINNWIFAQSSTSNNWTMANDLKSMIEQDELFRSVVHFIKAVNSTLVDAVLNQAQNIVTYQNGENLRDELLLNVTDTNICPETPIPYDLVTGFQFVNWLVLLGIAGENFKS